MSAETQQDHQELRTGIWNALRAIQDPVTQKAKNEDYIERLSNALKLPLETRAEIPKLGLTHAEKFRARVIYAMEQAAILQGKDLTIPKVISNKELLQRLSELLQSSKRS